MRQDDIPAEQTKSRLPWYGPRTTESTAKVGVLGGEVKRDDRKGVSSEAFETQLKIDKARSQKTNP
jgi:hypothetical protein